MTTPSREDITFYSYGLKCVGWYYPAPADDAPCIVMAHGLGSVKEMRLDAYAEKFQAAGYNAVVFDYRSFGDSEGEPKRIVDIPGQHADWHAALSYARDLPSVDSNRIILWGTSLSGGHVMQIGAEDGKVSAVISQVPHLDADAGAKLMGMGYILTKLVPAGLKDMFRKFRGKEPYYVPTFGEPGELAVMTGPGEVAAGDKIFPADSDIERSVGARLFLTLGNYSPVKLAHKITAPILFQAGLQDVTTPCQPAIDIAEKLDNAELITYDCGHFAPYVDPLFPTVIADQLEFLAKHVPVNV
jgi:pimeloyl-ACP methyl ester carboxylesterase